MSNKSKPEFTQQLAREIAAGEALAMSAAAKLLPGRGGRPCHPSRLARWAISGILSGGQVIRLESARIGNNLVTSRGAIERFVARQNGTAEAPVTLDPLAAMPRRAPSRGDQVAAALAELERAGA